ncbi:hypothetical protein [Rhizobium leguminosarum]
MKFEMLAKKCIAMGTTIAHIRSLQRLAKAHLDFANIFRGGDVLLYWFDEGWKGREVRNGTLDTGLTERHLYRWHDSCLGAA